MLLLVWPLALLLASATLSAPPATITVIAPNGGEVICPQHGDMVVSWSTSGLPAGTLINVDLYKNGVITNHIFRNIPITPTSMKWGEMFASGASGDGYKVRISTADGKVFDESDAPFSLTHVPLSVTMATPHGGERWKLGEQHRIEWTWTGCPWGVNTITVWLLAKPWDPYNNIVGTMTNMTQFTQGHFDWTVGDTLGGKIVNPNAEYKMEVFSIVFVPTYADAINPNRTNLSAASFAVLAEDGTIPPSPSPGQTPGSVLARLPPRDRLATSLPKVVMVESLHLLTPSGGERWTVGQLQRISWTWAGPSDRLARILLYRGKGLVGALGQAVAASKGFFEWRVGEMVGKAAAGPGDDYFVEIVVPSATAGQEHRSKSAAAFTIGLAPRKPPK